MSEETHNEQKQKPVSSWPASVRNNGERVKNWAAMLMGMAALMTAISTYINPIQDVKYKAAYESISKEVSSMSYEMQRMSKDIAYLYQVQRENDYRRRVALELEESAYKIEDRIIRTEMTKKYGKKFADQYMAKRLKHRAEIRQEYIGNIEERDEKNPTETSEHKLPPYGTR